MSPILIGSDANPQHQLWLSAVLVFIARQPNTILRINRIANKEVQVIIAESLYKPLVSYQTGMPKRIVLPFCTIPPKTIEKGISVIQLIKAAKSQNTRCVK